MYCINTSPTPVRTVHAPTSLWLTVYTQKTYNLLEADALMTRTIRKASAPLLNRPGSPAVGDRDGPCHRAQTVANAQPCIPSLAIAARHRSPGAEILSDNFSIDTRPHISLLMNPGGSGSGYL